MPLLYLGFLLLAAYLVPDSWTRTPQFAATMLVVDVILFLWVMFVFIPRRCREQNRG